MNVYKFNSKYKNKDIDFFNEGSKILLGEFETFHKGHFQLLEKARSYNSNSKIGIFIIDKKSNFQSLENRLNNLYKLKFDFVIVANFDYEFKSIEGNDFINYLDANFNVNHYIVGNDFKFGKDRKYEAKDLKKITKSKIDIIDIQNYQGLKISSSTIKQMHEFGEYNIIKEIIVNPLTFDGEINETVLNWDENYLKPHTGIYYCKILIENYWYHGIIHFSLDNLIHFFLVNYQSTLDILNQPIKIELLDILRIIINARFDKINDDDKLKAKKYFKI